MSKPLLKTLVTVAILVIFSAGFVFYKLSHKKLPPAKKAVVSTAVVTQSQWQASVEATGSFKANQGIMLKADTDGKIVKLNFASGQLVNKGDVLLEQNNTSQLGALDYAKAQYQLSKVTYDRNVKLVNKGAISAEELDQAKANMDSDEASMLQAQGEYDKTVIKAPFDGRIGLRDVSLGDYLDSGDDIVYLQNVDPLFVDFNVPEKYLTSLKRGLAVKIIPDSLDATSYSGTLKSYDTVIDTNTGTITVRSQVANKAHKLLPGGFAKVVLYIGEKKDVLSVPQAALVYDENGSYVYLVENGKAKQQKVMLGQQMQQDIIVTSGLKAGDVIVSAGANKVHDGSAISTQANTDSKKS